MRHQNNKLNNKKINNDVDDRKLFGIKTKDIPKSHPLRFIYPNKFK